MYENTASKRQLIFNLGVIKNRISKRKGVLLF
jgi:hypothetical protein